MKVTEKDATLILTYLLIYQDMAEAEDRYQKINTYGNQLKYITAYNEYERAMGHALHGMDPITFAEKLNKIKMLCNDAIRDLADNFSISQG